jgi:glycosyltransferase involved in cell wall biosynthesis
VLSVSNSSQCHVSTSAFESGANAPSVLHIVAPARYGGLESVVSLLAGSQRAAGHSTAVLAVLDAPATSLHLVEKLRQQSVPTRVVSVRPRGYIAERAMVRAVCAQLKPQVVHTHGYRPDILDAGVARRLGIRTVTTVHGFTGGSRRVRAYEWAQQRSFCRFDAVVAVSQPLAEKIVRAGVNPARVYVVPNAVPQLNLAMARSAARRRLGLPNDAFIIGSVGRVVRAKGFDLLIDALADSRIPRQTLLAIIGDGPDRTVLESHAATRGVSDRIMWCGTVDDAGPLYPAFDVFALASRAEGSPMSVLEAIRARVPVIASAVGGIPEIVSSGEAMLVPVGETEPIVRAIRDVQTSPDDARARAARASNRIARDLSLEWWIRRYASIYRSCVQSAAATASL